MSEAATPSAPSGLPESLSLAGRVALVTGASRGIGRAIARILASRGASVAVNYARSADAAQALCAEIDSAGGRAVAVGFDVSNAEAVEQGVDQVKAALGPVEILVNNAGISIDALLMRASDEDWERTMSINLTGAFQMVRACSRHLLKAKRNGRIINISSVVGEQGNVGQAMYSASKAGMLGLTKSLAREFAPRGVTVNAVTPGYIETEMTQASLNEEARAALLSKIPLGRVGAVNEIAEAVAFLAAPASAYTTGHVMRVNGGLLI